MTDKIGTAKRGSALPHECDVVIVGAGFGGVYMVHRLRQLGFAAHLIEAAGGVGGTWYWNRYPGARCDIESIQYSYAFDPDLEQEWTWTERYATQPEIMRYLEHVADRFGLWGSMTFDTRVVAGDFDESESRWTIRTDTGASVRARYVIGAVGCLSSTQLPDVPGLESFAGPTYHTGAWPHEGVDFAGKRVAVVGTGSSGVQIIPALAAEVDHLTVFQRTPNYVVPARNRALSDQELAEAKSRYATIREVARRSSNGRMYRTEGRPMVEDSAAQREAVLMDYWQYGGLDITKAYTDIGSDADTNEAVSAFIRARIADAVADPEVAERLSPRDYPLLAKRPCVGTEYFETYNRANVELVDVQRTPIVEITPTGVRTSAGHHDADAIVFATGYDAFTGSLIRLNLRGVGGQTLAEAWADGAQSYLGLAVNGFPNFFYVAGPGSPSVLSNMVLACEQHVEWLGDLLAHARDAGAVRIEASAQAQIDWTKHVAEIGNMTFLALGRSWYSGANTPGKPHVVLPYCGGTDKYRATCEQAAAAGYPGLTFTAAHDQAKPHRLPAAAPA